MPDYTQMLYDIEVHSVEGIHRYFKQGGNPNEVHDGIPLFTMMVQMYTRTPRFKDCVLSFIDHGLIFEDKALLAVFIDDADKLKALIEKDPAIINKSYALYSNTYTPLTGGTLMHFCAEYNCVNCASILLQNGADIDARAATDHYGFGGQTPIFHTVNQNMDNSAGMMNFLLENGADLNIMVKGLIWGEGYPWETFIPAVNPISYAMMGLLPQMHRKDTTVARTVSLLIKHAYDIDYKPANVPNAYLKH